MRFRPYPVMTVLAVAGLAVLLWLGSWQWARYQEKLALGERPPPEFETLSLWVVGPEMVATQQVYGLLDGQAVWRRYLPVSETENGLANGMILFDVIVSVEAEALGVARGEAFRSEFIRITPAPKRSVFTPSNKPDAGRWYTPDPGAMIVASGAEAGPEPVLFEPKEVYVRDLDGRYQAGGERVRENPWADPALMDDLPPARHLGYAITWWGLALTLIGVYVAFHVSRGRLAFGTKARD